GAPKFLKITWVFTPPFPHVNPDARRSVPETPIMSAIRLDEEALFHAARRITDPAARELFINQACGAEAGLAERVRTLLKMHDLEPESLEAPPSPTAQYEPVAERAGSRVGPYVLREQIGEGGFGLVFVADQLEPVRRKVALKIIKPGMDSAQVITRFE